MHAGVPSIAVAPYRPAAQSTHAPAPLSLNLPAGQGAAVGLVDPGTQAYPAVQLPEQVGAVAPAVAPYLPAAHGPEQAAEVRDDTLPYKPAAQSVQAGAAPTENLPGAQGTAVELVLPAGHAYPGAHAPVQEDTTAPGVEPYRPPSHGPVQAAVGRPDVAPYRPGPQSRHRPDPVGAYLPAGHRVTVALVLFAGQA